MKKIQLGGHKKNSKVHGYAFVDDCNYDSLNKFKWSLLRGPNTSYAYRRLPRDVSGKSKVVLMHRVVLKPTENNFIDHIDHNGLNNTRKNLRICTKAQNAYNIGKHKDNTSGYKGVSYDKRRKVWYAQIFKKKRIFLGYYPKPEIAYSAYCDASAKIHGIFANTG